ncbi:MAG: CBS domain-containing protein [Anaerolineae bacterium]|nr:CBS domain-containing protein [Anaerolineae bacterium]
MTEHPQYQRLTVYLGESDQWHGRPLWQALLERLRQEDLAGATVLRGLAGFGAHSRIKMATLVRLSADLPLMLVVVDRTERIEAVLPLVSAMVGEGLITLEPIHVVKYGHRYLPQIPRGRRVSEVMTTDPVAVLPDTPLAEVARLLLSSRFTSVPVVDQSGTVVGIVADADFLRWPELALCLRRPEALTDDAVVCLLEELAAVGHTAKEIMTGEVVTVSQGRSLAEAASLMVQRNVKTLPVVDDEGRLVGMLSRSDVIRQVAHEPQRLQAAPAPVGELYVLRDLMRSDVPAVAPEAPLGEVVVAMARSDLGRVVVLDSERRPLGVISDGDLMARVSPEARPGIIRALISRVGLAPGEGREAQQTAAELMSAPAVTVAASAAIAEGIRLLAQEGRRSIVLVDGEGRLQGIVDRPSLLRALLGGAIHG